MKAMISKNYTFTNKEYNSWFQSFDSYVKPVSCSNLKISIIIPIYHPDPQHIREAIISVINQTYNNWELILVEDGNSLSDQGFTKDNMIENDSRIKVIYDKKRKNISKTLNLGIAFSGGDWITFLDQDDKLNPNALNEIINIASSNNNFKLIFCDEDKFDHCNFHSQPNFKCGINYMLLFTQNYVCHLFCIKRDILCEIGKFSSCYDGVQDWEFCLRLFTKLRRKSIHHIPKVLYHWRIHEMSTSYSLGKNKTKVKNQSIKLLNNYLSHRLTYGYAKTGPGNFYSVHSKPNNNQFRVFIFVHGDSSNYEYYKKNLKVYCDTVSTSIHPQNDLDLINKAITDKNESFDIYYIFIDSKFLPTCSRWITELVSFQEFEFSGFTGPRIVDKKNKTVISHGMSIQNKTIIPCYYGYDIQKPGLHYRALLSGAFDYIHPGCVCIHQRKVKNLSLNCINSLIDAMKILIDFGFQNIVNANICVSSRRLVTYKESCFYPSPNTYNYSIQNHTKNFEYSQNRLRLSK